MIWWDKLCMFTNEAKKMHVCSNSSLFQKPSDDFFFAISNGYFCSRTIVDQMVQTPFMISLIFTLSTLAEGYSLSDCGTKLQIALMPTWKRCSFVWAPVQLVNQGIVPLKYRVFFQAVVSFFWDAYMSIASHSVELVLAA